MRRGFVPALVVSAAVLGAWPVGVPAIQAARLPELRSPQARAARLSPPPGCKVQAKLPETRQGHMWGTGLAVCSHTTRFVDLASDLQHRKNGHWVSVRGDGFGPGYLRANAPQLLQSPPVRCRPGRYRSEIVAVFHGTHASVWISAATNLTCR
jgi:hypothetical protein